MTDIKFCGMTRASDAVLAASLGARYVGCVLAEGPRRLTPQLAAAVFAPLDPTVGPRRAVVFPTAEPTMVNAAVGLMRLHVAQLHGDPTEADISAVRSVLGHEVWAVVRCAGGALPDGVTRLWDIADAVLLDAKVPGRLGGTGSNLPWDALREAVQRSRQEARRPGRLVVAGGLTPDNVGQAIAALRPDVVDTSSGIESAPGIKDPARMAAFVQAVKTADRASTRVPSLPASPR